jgi:5-methylcytosine-specific restriction endonuclease McrA
LHKEGLPPMIVYVKNADGKVLMPCFPAKARKLLQAGKATIVTYRPFTIQLGWHCEGHVQEVTLGIDKGSSVSGMFCRGNAMTLFAADVEHRRDVKEKMDNRRDRRKSRRSRLWYRPARFLNRSSSKRSGRLPPSILANAEEIIRVVKSIPLPITSIIVEDVQVDLARLNDPTLKGSRYQDPARLDENLRIACLMRDGYACQQCGKREVRLEAHHLHFREHGGKDTLANLMTLCEPCHHRLHEGKLKLKVTGVSGHLDQIAQRAMQGKTHLYARLSLIAPVSTVFGYETSAYRKDRALSKSHINDALCIATLETGEIIAPPEDQVYRISFRPKQTRKQFQSCPQKGKGRVRYQVNDEFRGFRKGDLVLVKGSFVKRINSIYSKGYLAFPRVKGEPNAAQPKHCQLLERAKTILWEVKSVQDAQKES